MADFQHDDPHEEPGLGSTMGLLSSLVNKVMTGSNRTRAIELIKQFQNVYSEQCETTATLEQQLAAANAALHHADNREGELLGKLQAAESAASIAQKGREHSLKELAAANARIADALTIFNEADSTYFEENALANSWYERLKAVLGGSEPPAPNAPEFPINARGGNHAAKVAAGGDSPDLYHGPSAATDRYRMWDGKAGSFCTCGHESRTDGEHYWGRCVKCGKQRAKGGDDGEHPAVYTDDDGCHHGQPEDE